MQIKRWIFLVLFLNNSTAFAESWNLPFIYGYLGSLLKGSIQEVVWFISDHLDPLDQENVNIFMKGVSEINYLSQYVWTNRTDVRLAKIGSKRVALPVVITTGAGDPVMYMHDRLLIGRHFNIGLIVYPYLVHNMDPIEKLCALLHRENFVNTMVYFQSSEGVDNIFAFKQFPKFHLINATDYVMWFRQEFRKLMDVSLDTGGYKWYTPLKQDVPSVFTYIDRYGEKRVQGTSYSMLKVFMQSINSSLDEYNCDQPEIHNGIINMKDILELVRSRKIQITAHAYALFHTDDEVDKSYPIMVVKWCLMVPLRNSISTYLYALQPFDWMVWLLVLIVFATLCLVDFLLWRGGVVSRNFIDLWINNYCHLLNIGPAYPVVPTSSQRCLYYSLVFWFGFFLTANYSSYLGSVLTVSLFREQVNTMEDLVKAQLPVMIIDYELEFLLAEDYNPPTDFKKLLVVVDSGTFYRHQMVMNDSFAYFITDDRWHFLHATQKHLKQKLFKFSDICFGSYHLAYPMHTDSPIWRNLEYFLFRIHSSGLFQMYESKALHFALETEHIKRVMETNVYAAAGLDHLAVMFALMGVMYLMGITCVMLEMIRYRRGNR